MIRQDEIAFGLSMLFFSSHHRLLLRLWQGSRDEGTARGTATEEADVEENLVPCQAALLKIFAPDRRVSSLLWFRSRLHKWPNCSM